MAKQKGKRRRQWRNPTYIGTVALAVVIITIFVVALINPGGSTTPDTPDLDSIPTPEPTPLVAPTPEPGGPSLSFGSPSVHNNGLFQVSVPSGWLPSSNAYDASIPRARISFSNRERLSVIDVLIQFGVNYPSHQALSDDFLTEEFFQGAWADYGAFEEAGRTVGDTVTVNFDLSVDGADFIGRQIAWLDGDWLHMVRVIVPENNPPLMEALTEELPPSLVGFNADQGDLPPTLASYVDTQQGFLVRHPGWRTVSGTPGGPAVLENQAGQGNLLLRVVDETPLESLDDAEAYITQTLRPDAEILSSQVTARQFAEGFLLSYADRDADGNSIAGVAALLNDAEDRLLVAEVRITAIDLDLLSVSEDPQVTIPRQIIDSFMVLPPADYETVPGENPPEEQDQ